MKAEALAEGARGEDHHDRHGKRVKDADGCDVCELIREHQEIICFHIGSGDRQPVPPAYAVPRLCFSTAEEETMHCENGVDDSRLRGRCVNAVGRESLRKIAGAGDQKRIQLPQ